MSNQDQIYYWNGDVGEKWVRMADKLDSMLAPFADAVITRAALQPGEAFVDIGCGAGALTLKAAKKVTPSGSAMGVDISLPLLGLAKHRATMANLDAQFIDADASLYQVPEQKDAIISRFGVMFFSDPPAAFANLRTMARPGGRITFMCWQAMPLNTWLSVPMEAVVPHLHTPPEPPEPGAPGPFAFADKDRLMGILTGAGWTGVKIEDWSQKITLPGATAHETADFMVDLGPAASLLRDQEIDAEPVKAELADLISAQGPVFDAACWLVSATTE